MARKADPMQDWVEEKKKKKVKSKKDLEFDRVKQELFGQEEPAKSEKTF
jgi:hypothetical protein